MDNRLQKFERFAKSLQMPCKPNLHRSEFRLSATSYTAAELGPR